MDLRPTPLHMYGVRRDDSTIAWQWVDEQLAAAGAYWVVPASGGVPHPRPVWGVWDSERLHLSIGSPQLNDQLERDGRLAVHLGSAVDVVIIEGDRSGTTTDATLVSSYDAKYDWTYDVDELGPLTTVTPRLVLAWRSAGWAGRDGFQATGRWEWSPEGETDN